MERQQDNTAQRGRLRHWLIVGALALTGCSSSRSMSELLNLSPSQPAVDPFLAQQQKERAEEKTVDLRVTDQPDNEIIISDEQPAANEPETTSQQVRPAPKITYVDDQQSRKFDRLNGTAPRIGNDSAALPADWTAAAWVLMPSPPFAAELPDDRWVHQALFATLEKPGKEQPNWKAELQSTDSVRATNAAIALARMKQSAGITVLTAAVRNSQLKLSQRQAAAEALGMIPTVKAKESTAQLLQEFGRFDGAKNSQYIAELHVELLTSWQRLAPHDAVAASRVALASSNPQVRLAALRCWQRATDIPLSNTEYDLAQDPSPPLRVLLLQLLAYRHDPRTLEIAQLLLNDQDLAVKIAALGALGEIKSEAAMQLLRRYQNDSGEIIRAAAYASLIKAGDVQAPQLAMKDQSWRVRKTICDYLATRPHVDLAKRLLLDRSIEVRRAMLTALEQWPWEQAAGLLLETATNESPVIRQTAIQQLRDRWIAAAELSVTATRERLQEQVVQLKVRLQRELGQVAEQLDQQVQHASDLLAVTDQELSKFSCRHQSWAKFLNRWNGANSAERRAAVLELATAIHELPCEEQVYTELHALLESEVDSNVWLAVIQLLANQHSPTVGTLLAIATSHQSAEVRKQSLDWYANHPHQQYQELLINSLYDDQVTVVMAALKALAALPKLPSSEPILILLEARDPAIRVAAAYALAAHGINPGYAALIRLTYDNQPAIRRQATLMLGELGDIRALEELLRLLDDRAEVQSAALLALEKLTGFDAAKEARWQVQAGIIDPGQATSNMAAKSFTLTIPQQAKCWKVWFQNQQQRSKKFTE